MTVDADVIRAAATSSLGVLALMVMIISIVALRFFKDADNRTKTFIFILLFAGVAGFASSVRLQARGAAEVTSSEEPPPGNNSSTRASRAADGKAGAAVNVTATGDGAAAFGTVNGNVTIQ